MSGGETIAKVGSGIQQKWESDDSMRRSPEGLASKNPNPVTGKKDGRNLL